MCKTCKKKRPERPSKPNKEITANLQKLTQELSRVDDKIKKGVTPKKYIGDDSFSNYNITKEQRSSSQNTNNRDSKVGGGNPKSQEESSLPLKKQTSSNIAANNYNSVDPRLNATRKKV